MKQKLTMGEKLKDLRTERGLTTKEVCRMTGVSENIYNGLENDIGRAPDSAGSWLWQNSMRCQQTICSALPKVVSPEMLR